MKNPKKPEKWLILYFCLALDASDVRILKAMSITYDYQKKQRDLITNAIQHNGHALKFVTTHKK
jgi:hypothetical protein